MSSKGTANRSWRTKAIRSPGPRVLSTVKQGRTEGVGEQRLLLGPAQVKSGGSSTTMGSSGRVRRERSIPRQTRDKTVVSQPPRLSMLSGVGPIETDPGFLDGVLGLRQ